MIVSLLRAVRRAISFPFRLVVRLVKALIGR